jgi:uncharacterized protein with FMN-binding domain
MIRRLFAVGLLTLASLTFALRFRPPPSTTEDLEALIASVEIVIPSTNPTYAPLPSYTTTTVPPLPPGVRKFKSPYMDISGRGVLQLEVTFDLGVITDIEMVKTPSSSRRAKEINLETHPILRAEALEIQHYRVHLVSGATETTIAWVRALREVFEEADFCTHSKCDQPIA